MRKWKVEGSKMALGGIITCGLDEIGLGLKPAEEWKMCEPYPSQEYKPPLAISTALSLRGDPDRL